MSSQSTAAPCLFLQIFPEHQTNPHSLLLPHREDIPLHLPHKLPADIQSQSVALLLSCIGSPVEAVKQALQVLFLDMRADVLNLNTAIGTGLVDR